MVSLIKNGLQITTINTNLQRHHPALYDIFRHGVNKVAIFLECFPIGCHVVNKIRVKPWLPTIQHTSSSTVYCAVDSFVAVLIQNTVSQAYLRVKVTVYFYTNNTNINLSVQRWPSSLTACT